MSVDVIHDREAKVAVLFDSVSETAFGPGFEDKDDAESFLTYAENHGVDDVRSLTDEKLGYLVRQWESVKQWKIDNPVEEGEG